MVITQEEYVNLLEKLDQISRANGWDIAGVVATFLAVGVALFFPLRDYIRTFPRFSLKAKFPEIREANLDGINKPHVGMYIKNMSKEVLYVKGANLYFDLQDYRKFRVCLPLGLEEPLKILPYSEDFVNFFIWHKDYDSGRNPIKEFLSTDKQILEHYLGGITGFEKVIKISLGVQTNLGRSSQKIPKRSCLELSDEIFYIPFYLDPERKKLLKKCMCRESINNKESFREYLGGIPCASCPKAFTGRPM